MQLPLLFTAPEKDSKEFPDYDDRVSETVDPVRRYQREVYLRFSPRCSRKCATFLSAACFRKPLGYFFCLFVESCVSPEISRYRRRFVFFLLWPREPPRHFTSLLSLVILAFLAGTRVQQ